MMPFSDAPETAARELNAAVESAIAFAPAQYLWTYNRYKVPGGVQAPSQVSA
jgi:Kdo2-lipid IVA lauroyltransferase/acyltransferase